MKKLKSGKYYTFKVRAYKKVGKKNSNGNNIMLFSIEKPTFGSIELANVVNNLVRSTDEDVNIECCGFCTDICLISNVLLIKTMLYDLNRVTISVLKDCCAGVTSEKHDAALEVMKSCQINVI